MPHWAADRAPWNDQHEGAPARSREQVSVESTYHRLQRDEEEPLAQLRHDLAMARSTADRAPWDDQPQAAPARSREQDYVETSYYRTRRDEEEPLAQLHHDLALARSSADRAPWDD